MSIQLLTVGKIVGTHGLGGEVKVLPQTDFADARFKKGSELTLVHPVNHATISLTVLAAKPHKNVVLVKFNEWKRIEDAQEFKGWLLKVGTDALDDLPEGEYYYHEIIGCSVVTDEGETLGTITEILSPGANDVWVVEDGQGKPIYVPVIDQVVLDVNVPARKVLIQVMEGMLE